MTTPDNFRTLLRECMDEAAGHADTGAAVIDRLLTDLPAAGTAIRPSRRRWIAPLVAAAAIAAVAVGIAVATGNSGRNPSGPPAAPRTSAPTSPVATGPTAGSTSASGTPTPTVANGAAPLCQTAQLQLVSGGSLGAAGTSYLTFYLTNEHAACTMTGFPGVAVLDASGAVVQRPADRSTTLGNSQPVAATALRIPSGGRAQFVVASTNTVPTGDCPALYRGTDLQVYPPDQTTALHLPGSYAFCDLRVGPVQADTSVPVKVLGLVRSHTLTSAGWRVVLAPAERDSTGQYVAIPGRAPVTYVIPGSMISDGGVTLVGPIELTVDSGTVTGLTIVGG